MSRNLAVRACCSSRVATMAFAKLGMRLVLLVRLSWLLLILLVTLRRMGLLLWVLVLRVHLIVVVLDKLAVHWVLVHLVRLPPLGLSRVLMWVIAHFGQINN